VLALFPLDAQTIPASIKTSSKLKAFRGRLWSAHAHPSCFISSIKFLLLSPHLAAALCVSL
ncbi:MAG: hypothetical protein WA644_17360, partial [Candidatus Acidiferrales bacterium]